MKSSCALCKSAFPARLDPARTGTISIHSAKALSCGLLPPTVTKWTHERQKRAGTISHPTSGYLCGDPPGRIRATAEIPERSLNPPNVSRSLLGAGATESNIKPRPLGFTTLHFVVHGSGLSGPWFPDSASTLLCLLLPSPHRFVLTSGSLRSSGKTAASYVPADFFFGQIARHFIDRA